MLIDCNTCVMRDRACGDCVVPVLLGLPELPELPAACGDEDERALQVLVAAGLVADVASCVIERELTAVGGPLRRLAAG